MPSEPVAELAEDSGLRALRLQESQAHGGPEFHVERAGAFARARNEAHALELDFASDRVVLTGLEAMEPDATELDTLQSATWQTSFAFAGIGRQAQVEHPAVTNVVTSEARVEYVRDGLTEWYVNGPLGLEQGFTVERQPKGEGWVSIAVAVDGSLEPVLAADERSVMLQDGEERSELVVSELFVSDADGRELASELAVENGKILLRFDDDGARYPVAVDPFVSAIKQTLSATGTPTNAYFGNATALQNGYGVVGAYGIGSVFVYSRAAAIGSTWTQQAKLTVAALPVSAGFGKSVALSPNTTLLAVGAPGDVSGAGAVYVFTRTGSTWSTPVKVVPASAQASAGFGTAVALDDNFLIVGEPNRDASSTKTDSGAVYAFERSGTSWLPLTPQTSTSKGAQLGASVAISGLTFAAGEPHTQVNATTEIGFAYVYTISTTTPRTISKAPLQSPTKLVDGGFGTAVALSSGTLAVSEPQVDGVIGSLGNAYVYTGGGSTWTKRATLVPVALAGAQYPRNGSGLSLQGNKLSMSHPFGSVQGFTIFVGAGATWTAQVVRAPHLGNDSVPSFGYASAVFGNEMLIGAPYYGPGDNPKTPSATPNQGRAFIVQVGLQNGDACTTGSVCSTGLCTAGVCANPPLANGSPCSAATACASNFCVDGVCCNSACSAGAADGADCWACSVATGATTNGTCATAPVNTMCRVGAPVAEYCDGFLPTCPLNIFP